MDEKKEKERDREGDRYKETGTGERKIGRETGLGERERDAGKKERERERCRGEREGERARDRERDKGGISTCKNKEYKKVKSFI